MGSPSKITVYYQTNYFSKPYVGHHFGAGMEVTLMPDLNENAVKEEYRKATQKVQEIANQQMIDHQNAANKASESF